MDLVEGPMGLSNFMKKKSKLKKHGFTAGLVRLRERYWIARLYKGTEIHYLGCYPNPEAAFERCQSELENIKESPYHEPPIT